MYTDLLLNSNAFESREAEKTAAALGRILMLDLVIRNEDRLPCRQLRWRGNSANLLLAEKVPGANIDALEVAFDSAIKRYRPKVIRALQKERRATSIDSRLSPPQPGLMAQSSDVSEIIESPKSSNSVRSLTLNESVFSDSHIVAIDSGVPRRPPAGKRANDQANYPKLVELLINSSEYALQLLHEITGGKLGAPPGTVDATTDFRESEMISVVHEFRSGFRAALRDLQGFHIFLVTLHQKLDGLLRAFLSVINKSSCGDIEKEELVVPETPSPAKGIEVHGPSSPSKERIIGDHTADLNDSESQRTAVRAPSSGHRESLDSCSPLSREGWHGKFGRGSGEPLRSLRLTSKLRDFHRFAKVDSELYKELEQWNDMLKNDAIKLCQENNFTTGSGLSTFLRMGLISDAANTEKPSPISGGLFIGGALAARSVYTLQLLGITHILCLCSNEIGQEDSQFPELFEYKNFSDSKSECFLLYLNLLIIVLYATNEETNISEIFQEAHDFINQVEQIGGKVLVHCFEGKSRSATLVLAYLMLRKKIHFLSCFYAETLLYWRRGMPLKQAHRRAQPNDGFARILLELDQKLHGRVSMEWQQRRPVMKVCPICGKNAGLSSSSLKLHLQKAHKKLSSGSVDSAMNMEIQKALDALKISRGGSVSPTQRQSHSMTEE
ncbi:Dual specificity protein phosphatase PHS1 [Sesamum angolense]|uniref:Dual specificity protein phosphatase PHS1 n=1 Tax=Sesamum angolense TaxID=2727404 RepID=A0AAE2BS31_9LAMI|nr:Dual specificity protein phosphatase PHS1 [Sesamum angolense]